MPNYQNGKIYGIRSVSNPDLLYVGSTTDQLSKRLYQHKNKSNKSTSKQIIDLGDAYIELIENYACNSKEELLKREGEIMRSMECVNKCNPVFIKCPHNKRKSVCKDCGGSQFCSHNREKSRCKDCGGASICHHNRQKTQCKDCNNYYCRFCNKKFSNKTAVKYHNGTGRHIYNYIHY